MSNVTTYGYDAAANLTSVTDPLSNVTTYAYDAHDRLTSITRPEGGVSSFTYDDDDRRITSTDPLSNTTTYGYDDAGRLTSETDPRSNTTSYTYDAAGRRTVMTDALSGTVTWAYDAAGQVTSITDPNSATRSMTYDLAGRLKTATNAAGKTWTYYYNAAGRTTAVDDPRGFTISHSFDDAGRPTSTTAPGISITTTYDTAGRRSTLADTTGTTTWGYDPAGNVTSVAAPSGTVSYSFDDADRRATMTTPESTLSYTYDAAGRVTALVDTVAGTFGFGYDDDGRRTSIERPNDVDTAAVYNAAGQPTSITHTDTTTTTDIEAETYTYDAAGNVTSVTDLNSVTTDYTIDALNRLTETDDGTTVTAYTYDAAGNRLTETIGAVTTDYTYNSAGQLTETDDGTTTVAFTYDDAGNTITAGSTDYTWNWANQLVEIDDGTVVDLAYNGDGDLTEIDTVGLVNDTTAGLPTLVAHTAGDAYLHHEGILAETTTGGTLYTHTDNQNTVDATTNTSRTVTTADYTAYGETLAAPATVHGYTGEPEHTTGLTYLRARHYNPDHGRLLTADTVQPNAAGTQGYNLYTYTANNPTTWTDPSGNSATIAIGPGGAAAESAAGARIAVVLARLVTILNSPVTGWVVLAVSLVLVVVWLMCNRTSYCPEHFEWIRGGTGDLGAGIEQSTTHAANGTGQDSADEGRELHGTESAGSYGDAAEVEREDLIEREGAMAEALGRSVREVKGAIHGAKRKMLVPDNADVLLDPRTGELYPETPTGGIGDSIGNIYDFLP